MIETKPVFDVDSDLTDFRCLKISIIVRKKGTTSFDFSLTFILLKIAAGHYD
jgi:hypothetical protein